MSDDYLKSAFWRHVKTGDTYHIIGFSTRESGQMTLVQYRKNGPTENPIWSRTLSEFMDGRFVRCFSGQRI